MRVVVATIVVLAAQLAFVGAPADATSAATIDTTDRVDVLRSYTASIHDATRVHHHWNGDTSSCNAGSTSSDYEQATLASINWFRAMVGLHPVQLERTSTAAAQSAALMMHAEAALDHYPKADWACFSSSGAASAGLSNLTLGVAGARGIVAQVEDPGVSNTDLGHRRWLLYSKLDHVGIGNTSFASAISVIDGLGSRVSAPEWVSWPPSGFTPSDMVFPRWSLSNTRNADFSNATVTMKRNGVPVPVKLLPVVAGFGDDTLGWEPLNADPTPGYDTVYEVTVSGISTAAGTVSHRFEVIAFDPNATTGSSFGDDAPTCRSLTATIVGTDLSETIEGTPGDDVIVALGGNDTIHGLGGNDVICGGDGHDTIHAGPGSDVVLGGRGRDVIRGGSGDDRLDGQTGRDRLSGNSGHDELIGGPQRDNIRGNTGSDLCLVHRPGDNGSAGERPLTCER